MNLNRNKSEPFMLVIVMTFFVHQAVAFPKSAEFGGRHLYVSEKNLNAKELFYSGVLLLHSFQYEEARAKFESAVKLSPHFAMAYWGWAMTYNHPLWNEQDYSGATKVLKQLNLTSFLSELERGFIEAVHKLYGSGTKAQRDLAHELAMYKLYRKFPDNEEAAAFYALAILGSRQGNREFTTYMKAAGILESIYSKNQHHPGVLHYLIHCYDDPVHAPLGLRFARTYAKIAPDAPHALHMPSHIYLALGMWEDVRASNQAAWEAGLKRRQNSGNFDVHALHSLQWLIYALLQLGKGNDAFILAKMMQQIALQERPADPMYKWYYALIRATYIINSKDWNADLLAGDLRGVETSALASQLYVETMKLLVVKSKKPDLKKAQLVIKMLDDAITTAKSKKSNVGSGCHNDKNYFASVDQGGLLVSQIVSLELKAQLALASGNLKQALKFAEQAVTKEKETSVGYGPPLPIKPAAELLAEIYGSKGQFTLAYKYFFETLVRMPNRALSLSGLQETGQKLRQLRLPVIESDIKLYYHELMDKRF